MDFSGQFREGFIVDFLHTCIATGEIDTSFGEVGEFAFIDNTFIDHREFSVSKGAISEGIQEFDKGVI